MYKQLYTQGNLEGITIAIFFGGVGIPPLVELSPIVGVLAILEWL